MPRIAVAVASFVCVLAIAAGACASSRGPATSSRGATSDTERVAAAMQRYASFIKSAPPDSVASMYAPDGELVLPGLPVVHGPAAIRAFLAPMKDAVTVEQVSVTSDSVTVTGNEATQSGTFRQTVHVNARNTTDTAHGTYDARWHRDPAGQWRIVRLSMHPVS